MSFREGCVGVGRVSCYRRFIVPSLWIIVAAVGCCSAWKRWISDHSARRLPGCLAGCLPSPLPACAGTEEQKMITVLFISCQQMKRNTTVRQGGNVLLLLLLQEWARSHKDISTFFSFLKPDGPDFPLSIVFWMGFLRAKQTKKILHSWTPLWPLHCDIVITCHWVEKQHFNLSTQGQFSPTITGAKSHPCQGRRWQWLCLFLQSPTGVKWIIFEQRHLKTRHSPSYLEKF